MAKKTNTDNVYTIFDKVADGIRNYKVSARTKAILQDLAKSTLKTLANIVLAKSFSKSKFNSAITTYSKKVTKEISKDIKAKGIRF